MTLTLVPVQLARPGYRFAFTGPNAGEECRDCPFQKLCFGLAPGHVYEVTRVRDVEHPCNLHEPGRVRVVEVQQTAFTSTVERRRLRGTAATWTPIPCGRPDCAHWALCHPVGPAQGASYAIEEVGETVACPARFDIARVRLRARDAS